ncbi:ATP-binding protein [Candidatus Chloroploca sp. Khr17]|uniref:GAF domain-containing protein n=1 Tax=Candidatus Chloroploca sp. Khr17 TaxID=2496869 RepID=UPI00101D3E38|nr:ATP-binding protein [Candidatus Chloroploca sp. Khr17]
MDGNLATWLEQERATLLPRWYEVLAHLVSPEDTGAVDQNPVAGAAFSPQQLDLATFYTTAVLAATGDREPFAAQLRAFFTQNETSFALTTVLRFVQQVRRITSERVQATAAELQTAFALFAALDALFDDVLLCATEHWSATKRELIREHEFIAERLDAAAASADRQTLQLQALNVISRQLSLTLEEHQLIDLLIQNLQHLTAIAHIALWQPVTEAYGTMLVLRQRSDPLAEAGEEHQVAVTQADDLIVRAWQTRQNQFLPVPEVSCPSRWLYPTCGVLVLPMIASEQVVALVVLQDPDPFNQIRMQQDLIQSIVSQTAIALQNAMLYSELRILNKDLERRVADRTRELEDEKNRLATIYQISTEVSRTLDLDALLATSLQLLAELTHAEHGSIMLVEPDDSSLMVTRAVLGVIADPKNYLRFPIGVGIAGWVAEHCVGVVIDDISQDARWISVPGLFTRRREGAMIAVPLVVQDEVLGVLSLSHRQVGFFQEDHLRMLNATAGSIAVAVKNANLFALISEEAARRFELLDRQEKEATQIQAILQSLSDGVIVCDLSGRILVANPAAAAMMHRSLEELLLWNLHEILMRYMGERTRELPLVELLEHPLLEDEQPRRFMASIKLGVRTLHLLLGPVLTEMNTLIGALLVLRDVTREVEADQMKNEFIGTMSHELRTPMTAIKGFTQLLAMDEIGALNVTQREFVTTIDKHTQHMINLINDVLDLTRIEAGSVELEWRLLHLAQVLSGVMAELKLPLRERGHSLTITLAPHLPLVRADAHCLHQVLYHLLNNAIKYTPTGGQIHVEALEATLVELPVEVRDRVPQAQPYNLLRITDTGVGIAPTDLPRIFDRFYRADNPLKVEGGGAGLGLALTRPLVELLGGQIWVTSEVGVGSTFSFILPAVAAVHKMV